MRKQFCRLGGCLCVVLIVLLTGCAEKIDVFSLSASPQEESEKNEFVLPDVNISRKRQVLLTTVRPADVDPVKQSVFSDVENMYRETVESSSNMRVNLQSLAPAETLKILWLLNSAENAKMDVAAVLRQEPVSFEQNTGGVFYKIQVTVDYYQVSGKKLIGVNRFMVESGKNRLAAEEIRHFLTEYFPARGFVTETKANRSVARLNAGSLSGFRNGDPVLFRDTSLTQSSKQTDDNVIYVTERLEYSDTIIGYGEIILINDEFCWVAVESDYRKNIRPGVVGFAYKK